MNKVFTKKKTQERRALLVRLPEELLRRVRCQAALQGLTMQDFVEGVLEKHVARVISK